MARNPAVPGAYGTEDRDEESAGLLAADDQAQAEEGDDQPRRSDDESLRRPNESTPLLRDGQLRRVLGLPGAIALGLSSILGTGVYVSIGLAAQMTGPSVVLATAIACLTATLNALNSAQLAALYPVSGATYEYAARLLHPSVGFFAGWMFLCAKVASGASAAMTFATYLLALTRINLDKTDDARISPLDPLAVTGVAFALVVLLTSIVLAGLRPSNRANFVLLSITLGSLGLFVGAGAVVAVRRAQLGESLFDTLPFFAPAKGTPYEWREPALNLAEASATMFVAFTGYGRVATLGGEVRNPRRTLPRAIVATTVASAAVYMTVGAVAIGTAANLAELAPAEAMPDASGTVAAPVAPLIAVAARALPAVGIPAHATAAVLSAGAVTATAAVLLNLVLGLSRMCYAMARRGDLPPRFFARVTVGSSPGATPSPAPAVALVGAGIAAAVAITRGRVAGAWAMSAVSVLVYYGVLHAAAARIPDTQRTVPRWVAYVGGVFCLGLAAFVDKATWIAVAIIAAVGGLWHAIAQRWFGEDCPAALEEREALSRDAPPLANP